MSASPFSLENLFGVKGKTVVVTGGGTGIGKGIADAFVTNGAKVFIVGRRKEVVDATAAELSVNGAATGGVVIPIQGDVSSKDAVAKVFEAISAQTDVVDVLVNCAGVVRPHRGGTIADVNDINKIQKALWDGHDDEDWQYTSAINTNAVYFMSVAFVPLLLKSEVRSIINIASIAGIMLARALASVSYGTTKAGTIHMTKLLAGRFSPAKIRVNCICPGIFPSEFTGSLGGATGHAYQVTEGARKAALRSIVGRPGLPEEVGGPCVLLGSNAGGFMNGAVLVVDGGRCLVAGINDGIKMPDDQYMC
ncbi:uncharacterized protein EHS24_007091 [Apiotrichum porosum]|uniref:Uncharacterized protein n=1 Tax=Apiotrichum porosum TaxID=105984 RepID=A0A427XX85_9TREE|nr:uncharacterized protein EHS24_007091 [Apiotrichum porosum]RSH83407.1 hypothetical protein EHS24_007091 [Apiotrichum porosum]